MKLHRLVILFFTVLSFSASAQKFDINDPIIDYDPENAPAKPANGNIVDWVRTPAQSWNTDKWKSYYLSGMPFRLRFPNDYDPDRAEEYPMIVIIHGLGYSNKPPEAIYENEKHLSNSGAKAYEDAINQNKFDGFILSPASLTGWFNGNAQISIIRQIINQADSDLNLDINRVSIVGRSGGAWGSWSYLVNDAKTYAAVLPLAGTDEEAVPFVNRFKHIPIWVHQGENDDGPSPQFTESVIDDIVQSGAQVRYTKWWGAGHGIFNQAYGDSDYFPFLSRVNKANPSVLNGVYTSTFNNNKKIFYEWVPNTEPCPGDNINLTLGLTDGFNEYQWRKDGVLIPGATGHEITVTELGTYDARFRRGSEWSAWSPIPVEIRLKDPTLTPDIEIEGVASAVIPTLDNKSYVNLELPQGFAEYEWRNAANNQVVSNDRVFQASQPGDYFATVTENFGCSSSPSSTFTVIDANGAGGPSALLDLDGAAVSKTDIKLVWSSNPNDLNPATGFEIYRSAIDQSSFEYLLTLDASEVEYTDSDLLPDTEYYYKVRAVNSDGASAELASSAIRTQVDQNPPTPPTNLRLSAATTFSATLTWDASTDDVEVYRYDIYRDGIKVSSSASTTAEVFNLVANRIYTFLVKARDLTGNESTFSNRLTVSTGYSAGALANLRFNGDLSDESASNTISIGPSSFDTNDLVEGSASYSFNGNTVIDFADNQSYIHDAFTERSVALWFKSTDANGTQDLFDEGGSTNGFGIRLVNQTLEVGARDNNILFDLSAPIVRNQWTHVVATYKDATLRLYMDGVLVDQRTDINFPDFEVSTHSDEAGLGGTNGSNAFNTVSDRFTGFVDDLYVFGYALGQTDVSNLYDVQNVVAIPDEEINAPESITATATSYDAIEVTWSDVSDNEESFQIYRSENNGPSLPIAFVGANVTSYTDEGLKPSTKYAYQVIALTQYNESGTSVAASIPSVGHYTFEGNYQDQSSNNINTGINGSAAYSSDSQQGSSSFQFNGSTFLDPDTGNKFIHAAFSERSFAFWYKSSDASGTQDVIDEGGSTNGIGIRLVNQDIQFTAQNGHQIFSVQAPATRNEWHHVVAVFDNGSMRLYLDGTLAAQRDDVSYTVVNSHNNGGGIGGTNSSNAFDVVSSRFTGLIDDLYFFDTAVDGLVGQIIQAANPANVATTLDLPPAPVAPTNLTLNEVGFDFVDFSFEDVSSNEDYFVILRAINTANSFQPLDTLSSPSNGVLNFVDQNLQSNITYFYKVAAVNAGGAIESSSLETRTLNYVPELSGLPDDFTMQFSTTLEFNILANDVEGDALVITGDNIPSFGTLIDYTDGSGLLRFSPTETDGGVYSGIEITVTDAFNGSASHVFELTVNGNSVPTLSEVSNVSLDEGTSTTVTLAAADEEGVANLDWTFDIPDFVSTEINPDGTADFDISPGFADAGTYTVSATVEDQDGASATSSFDVTVADVNPNRLIQVNFTAGALLGGSGWNNTDGHPRQGDTYNNLVDEQGNGTGFSLTVVSNWTNSGSNNSGSSTGNNSGVLPDNVMRSAYWTYTKPEQIRLSGLDDSKLYKLGFFGSRNASDNRTSLYTVAGQSTTLNAAGNTTNMVDLTVQSSGGELLIQIERAAVSTFGYLNALLIEELVDTGLAPDAPNNLVANFNASSNRVELSWNERAFNETGYRVYKSSTSGSGFTEIASLPIGSDSYNDNDVDANTDYYYQIGVFNDNGESLSDEILVAIPNVAPAITAISDVSITISETLSIPLQAVDDPADVITLSVDGLPTFGSFIDNTDGTGSISFDPNVDDIGSYPITIIASDDKGGESEESFTLDVAPAGIHTYFINMAANNGLRADAPWNNYVGRGVSGNTLSGISAQESGYNNLQMTFLDSWGGNNTAGMTGSSVFPNDVTRSSIWVGTNDEKRISLSGFDAGNAYDITLFGSRNGGGNRTTEYSIDGSTVSLNASFNQNNTVTIEGVLPNGAGEIILRTKKAAGASYGYINAIVIEGYQAEALPADPTDLTAAPVDGSSIVLGWKDNTNLETDYEVWRSTSINGSYALVATLAPNTITYTNSGVSSGITYYYKVRAILDGGAPTEFSNVAGTSTINSIISVNFNVSDPEVVEPWNNTNSFPDPGLIFGNLSDANGNNTGVAMEIVAENPDLNIDPSLYGFSGDNPFGENTGSNSGVVPDNVMRSTYWMDAGRVAELKFFNLDLSQNYNFKFFASRDGGGDRTTVYSINGESVSLNASNNVNNIVGLNNITPDDNGEIWVQITSGANASFSYIGGIIMSSSNRVVEGARYVEQETAAASNADEQTLAAFETKVYPNPYKEGKLSIITGSADDFIGVTIFDMNGRRIFSDEVDNLIGTLEIDNLEDLDAGSYIIHLRGEELGSKSLRLMKN